MIIINLLYYIINGFKLHLLMDYKYIDSYNVGLSTYNNKYETNKGSSHRYG